MSQTHHWRFVYRFLLAPVFRQLGLNVHAEKLALAGNGSAKNAADDAYDAAYAVSYAVSYDAAAAAYAAYAAYAAAAAAAAAAERSLRYSRLATERCLAILKNRSSYEDLIKWYYHKTGVNLLTKPE